MAKVASSLKPGVWAYALLSGEFGQVVDAGAGDLAVRLYDRNGQALNVPEVKIEARTRLEWCRIRRPSFPIPPACRNMDDWLVRDLDFAMPEHEVDAVFAVARFWDLDAFTAFYKSRGMDGNVSIALREQAQALEASLPAHGYASQRVWLAQLPLLQYLCATVRPRGVEGRHSLSSYPLSEAMEDWAQQHEYARDLAGLNDVGVESVSERERDRE